MSDQMVDVVRTVEQDSALRNMADQRNEYARRWRFAEQRADAAEQRAAALTAVLREIRDLADSDQSDTVIACTVGAWAQDALAASGGAAPAERAGHEYEGACRNVQHAATGACACNALVNGRLCRLSRINPIHERQQPPAGQEGRG